MTCTLDSTVMCILEPQMFVHWLLLHRVASVTSHLVVCHSLRVSLQVCYWLSAVQGVSNHLRSNCKVNFSVHGNWVFELDEGAEKENIPNTNLDVVKCNEINGNPVMRERHVTVMLQRVSENFHQHFLRKDVRNINSTVSLLASHQGEPVSIPGRVTPGFSQEEIVPDDAAGRRIFSGISRFPRLCIPAPLQYHYISPSSALKTLVLRAAYISQLNATLWGGELGVGGGEVFTTYRSRGAFSVSPRKWLVDTPPCESTFDQTVFYVYTHTHSPEAPLAIKAVHDKVRTFENDLRKKKTATLPAYTSTGAPSDMRPVKLVATDV
ncbi:hypothetical protein PR048_032365 [Dryococelus australis]|uniref:Uncharacterized protein n=1 Tax=Dryococelus australis TaxID=614101 RepID=A0ABQ9G378_9NEOP|nr:hypothetical protein PR048_032365 [Dryococelus australis]